MRNILITGGTTFVSKFAAAYFLKQGGRVFVINRGSRPQVDGVTLLKFDRLRLGDTLKGFHFDAVLDVCAYTEEHVTSLLDALGAFDDYILISSSAVYPETNPQPFSEEQTCGKNAVWGGYGENKLAAENALKSRVENAYILRPPYLYGVYENLYREAFVFDCAMADRPFYLPSDGSMTLQFFNVKDLCALMDVILRTHPQEHLLNVGNAEAVSVKEWVTLCYRAAGKTPSFISVDPKIPQRNYFPFHNYEYLLDVKKQQEIFPRIIPLFEGLKEEFLWYRDNPDSVYVRKPFQSFIDEHLR